MANADRDYCFSRADEVRERAAASDAPDIAQRHATLARLYELRATDPAAWAALSTQKSA